MSSKQQNGFTNNRSISSARHRQIKNGAKAWIYKLVQNRQQQIDHYVKKMEELKLEIAQ